MKSNSLCASVLFLAFFISTGFIFSTHSSIDFEENSPSQTDFVLQDTSKEEIDKTYTIVDKSAEFKGGMEKFYKYVAKNLNYPKNARENGVEGRVFVVFVVDKDGSIVEAKVVKGIDPELDAEALRVVQNSPKWIPAVKDGKNVRIRMNIPINFTLDKSKKNKKG